MNMKKIIYIGILMLLVSLTSCYEELGNYDYVDLASIEIKKIDERVCAKGEVLDVIPKITLKGDSLGDSQRYEYSWVARSKDTKPEEAINVQIGNERNLYYQMSLPAGKYLVVYTIKDKETGLQWINSMQLTVTGAISEGWLILTAEEQADGSLWSDLSVYARNTTDGTFRILNNILDFSNFPYRKGPRQIVYKKATGLPKGEIHILTDEAVGWLDDKTDLWQGDQLLKYVSLEALPVDYTFKSFEYFPAFRHSFGFTEDGGLRVRGEFSGGAWGIDIAYAMREGKKVKLDLAPYIGGVQSPAGCSSYLIFDKKSKSFMTCFWPSPTSNEANCSKLTDTWAATGMDMIYMQSVGSTGMVYALLKATDGKIYQYAFRVMGAVVMLDPVAGIKELNAPNLLSAEHITYNQTYTDFLYYSVGNKLYTYYNGKETLVKTMNGDITCLKSQFIYQYVAPYTDYMKYLLVGTYEKMEDAEKSEGKVTIFLPTPGKADVLEVADEIKHLQKVISIDYQK